MENKDQDLNQGETDNIDKNINLFQYLINIDCYINDYLYILYLKKNKTDQQMIIDHYYINFFKKIINDVDVMHTEIVTIKETLYKNLTNKNICLQVNHNYLENTSISYLYLYYIIKRWDNLPTNVFFYNLENENTFPIEMYIVPKSKIDFFSNNHGIFNLNGDNLILSKKENKLVGNFSFKLWWEKFIKKNIPNVFQYCPELTFSVKRENIKKNGKQYYQDIFNFINKNPYCRELYYLDRCWYYIFI